MDGGFNKMEGINFVVWDAARHAFYREGVEYQYQQIEDSNIWRYPYRFPYRFEKSW